MNKLNPFSTIDIKLQEESHWFFFLNKMNNSEIAPQSIVSIRVIIVPEKKNHEWALNLEKETEKKN